MKTSNNVCEENTFARLYGDLGAAIRNFIYFKCGDTARAEDLAHEAFIKLWQNCAKVPQEKAKSFLYTVSNNMFLNEVAHQKVVLQHAKLQPHKVNAQSPEYLLEEKQIAEILSISVKAVEKRMSQALASLRKEIEEL